MSQLDISPILLVAVYSIPRDCVVVSLSLFPNNIPSNSSAGVPKLTAYPSLLLQILIPFVLN